MSADCLILNRDGRPLSFFPLSVVDWHSAIKLTLNRKVFVVKDHSDWIVRSPSMAFNVPSIIMLSNYHHLKKEVKFSRSNVFSRDNYVCQYCEKKFPKNDLTLDHVIPISKGGDTSWENVTTSCKGCNNKKGNSDLKPLTTPKKPTLKHMMKSYLDSSYNFKDEEWTKYIDID